jgi:hypothetical protein
MQQRLQRIIMIIPVMLITGPFQCLAAAEEAGEGWQLQFDNNITGIGMHDRDYTAGLALTLSGTRARHYWFSVDAIRAWIDHLLGLSPRFKHAGLLQRHSVQLGMVLYTPQDLVASSPAYDDRPYASLFFVSNTQLDVDAHHKRAYRTTFTLGALGLKAGGEIQNYIHGITDSDVSNGWDNQVSANGELTAMYTISIQQPLYLAATQDLTTHYEANIGFSTDLNAGISWRRGVIKTPWWSFNPSHNEYIASAAAPARGAAGNRPEAYVFAGANLKYRFYSAILQGQFRDSAHTLGQHEVEHLLATAWLGVTREFADNLRWSLSVRGSSPEFSGPNARNLLWASLVLNRAW